MKKTVTVRLTAEERETLKHLVLPGETVSDTLRRLLWEWRTQTGVADTDTTEFGTATTGERRGPGAAGA